MTEETTKPMFEIHTIDDFKRIFTIARGGDPDAQQIISKFLEMNNKMQQSNFPNNRIVHFAAYTDLVSKLLFPDRPDNPFARLRDSVADAFMGKGGWKSNGFVEIVKQTPSMSDLQAMSEVTQPRGLRARLFGGGSSE